MSKVTVCGLDTSALPKLNKTESENLLRLALDGDNDAREKFVYANMRLVLSIVGRFSNSHENPDDLFQVGMVGLLKALNNFDVSIGVCFSTYAVPMIIGEIKKCLRDRTGIKVSRSMRDTAFKALKARESLSDSEKEPELVEIAEEIGIPLSDVACALDAVSDTLSFYEPVYGEEEGTLLIDKIADDRENADIWSERISLEEAMKQIPEKEMNVLRLRYYEGKTQVEISAITGISQAQISRLETSAIQKLRKTLTM